MDFLAVTPKAAVKTKTVNYAALDDLRAGRLQGAAVLPPKGR